MRTDRPELYVFAILLLAIPITASTEPIDWDTDALSKVDPAELGYATHSSILIDGSGKVLWSFGDVDEKLQVFSIRKSLVSTLFGTLLTNNQIELQMSLAELGIDDKQSLSDQEKTATVLDLLKSRSGVYHPAAYETPRMFKNRPNRNEFLPGEHWFYNNWDFNTSVTIFEKLAEKSVGDAFQESIATPLEMAHFSTQDVHYVYEDASLHPAATFAMSASDLTKFGLLLLHNGVWNGQQIIPADWVEEMTSPHSDIGMFGGYGYSWWVALNGLHLPFLTLPDGTFSARGTGEQMVLVIPSIDVVWVHRTRITSPGQEMMKVVQTARLLRSLLGAHRDGSSFIERRF